MADAREDTGVGARLRRLRTSREFTQRELAGSRYSAAFVSSVESGRRTASSDALRYFADRLRVSYDELATGRPASMPVELGLTLAEATRALSAGDRDRARRLCAAVERSARDHGLPLVRARARLGLARCALHDGDVSRAADLYASAEDLLAGEPLPTRAAAVAGRARCLRLSGEPRYAAYVLESALDELRRSGLLDPDAMVELLTGLVTAYLDMGRHDKAASAGSEALALSSSATDPARIGSMHIAVAQALVSQRRVAEAEASLARAYEAFRQLSLRNEIGWCHWARGYMLLRADRLDEAGRELSTARDILRSTGSPLDVASLDNELAELERRKGRPDAARRILEEALRRFAGQPDLVVNAETRRLLGAVARDQGLADEAEQHLRAAAELYERAKAVRDLATTLRLLGDLLRDGGRLEQAARTYQRGLRVVEGPP